MWDLLIRNGVVIDGTGNPGFFADVGVRDEEVFVLRGTLADTAAGRELDARQKVVCPGFIDMHSHGGLTILGEPRHEPKVRQGITTELIGVDGNSVAPFKNSKDLHDFIDLDSGLNGKPPLPATWSTVAEYLSTYDNRVAVNICYILGNAPVRIWSVGWDDRPAIDTEINDMKAVVREAVEEGAFGLSTGLDYPPGSFADTHELVELSKVVATEGGFYHTHTRSSLSRQSLLAPWEEALDIGRKSGIPVHLTHYRQREQGVGSHLDYIGLVEEARDEGLDVTFDCYPYIYSSTRAIVFLPHWTQDGGPDRLRRALSSSADRKRIREDMESSGRTNFGTGWLTNFQNPDNVQYEGCSLREVARLRGQDIVECFLDLVLEEDLGLSSVGYSTNPSTLPAFVSHPYGMVGSDALLIGEYPSPRTYGCFPVILAEFVRAEKHLRLPEAIRKMTSFPAQRLGLKTRGVLRDGMKADIVVFDPGRVKALATPTRPKQFPLGIDYVIVNGTIVVDDGKHTGATAGRALRFGRD